MQTWFIIANTMSALSNREWRIHTIKVRPHTKRKAQIMGSTRSHLGIKLLGLAELAATFNQFHSSMGTSDFEEQPQVSYFHL